ncbi:MAG: DUF1080 domain-containing protein [Kiritimatiellae bacterium]|nr:DUF1080 domain-containing protein [Kiritimatiellia bacterium]
MKNRMNLLAACALVALAGCCSFFSCDYPSTIEEGFVPLESGNGMIYGEGNPITEKEYGNFILRLEFMMPENGNNGLGIRTPDSRVDAAYHGMCELQLLDDGGSAYYDQAAKKDKLKPYQYTGSIYGIVPSRRDNVDKQIWGKEKNFTGGGSYVRRPGMWNFEEVRVIGSEIEVLLNGYVITRGDVSQWKGDGDTPDKRPHPGLHRTRGYITFCGHGSDVKFRNVRIRELPDDAKMDDVCPKARMSCPRGFTAYFDGDESDLDEFWKGVTTEEKFDNPIVRQAATSEKRAEMQKIADKGRDEHWSVRRGTLCFDGFRGGYSLATKEDYEDFEMWADWRILSVTGDSGLYLRGSPQVQIWDAHNQWHIGSGGLYNNQKNPSKALVIADRQVGDWNRFHVIMRGDKVTVWLNGALVVDNVTLENYWDRKRPIFFKEQIELQCHGDPTEWRNIFIRPLPPVTVPEKRVGVCSWSWRKPLTEVAEAMDKAGVKGIHLALGPFIAPDERHGAAESKEAWEFVKSQVKSGKWNVMATMVGTIGEDYSTLETIRRTGGIVPDATWEGNQKIVTEGAKLTKELGCRYMSLHAGFLDENDPKAYAKFVERVEWIRDEAKKYGVTILLESGQETAVDLVKFLEKVPGVYVNFDPANMILYGKGEPREAVKLLAPWIRQVHVKDALFTQKPGTWGSEVPWGDGSVGARSLVEALEAFGYRGNYVIEREGGDSRAADIGLAAERLMK